MKLNKTLIAGALGALVFLGAGCGGPITPNLNKNTETIKQMLTAAQIQFTAEDMTSAYQTSMGSATISKATHLVLPAGAGAYVNIDVFEYLVSDTRTFIQQMINEGIQGLAGVTVEFIDVGEPKLLVAVSSLVNRDEAVVTKVKAALQK